VSGGSRRPLAPRRRRRPAVRPARRGDLWSAGARRRGGPPLLARTVAAGERARPRAPRPGGRQRDRGRTAGRDDGRRRRPRPESRSGDRAPRTGGAALDRSPNVRPRTPWVARGCPAPSARGANPASPLLKRDAVPYPPHRGRADLGRAGAPGRDEGRADALS